MSSVANKSLCTQALGLHGFQIQKQVNDEKWLAYKFSLRFVLNAFTLMHDKKQRQANPKHPTITEANQHPANHRLELSLPTSFGVT